MDRDKALERVGTRSLPVYPLLSVAIAVSCLLLRSDALRTGFIADDVAQLAMLEHGYPLPRAALPRSAFNLFEFSDGSEREARPLFETGFYPWYAHRGLRLSMFRPLASVSIWLDHELFGSDPLPYHLHSALVWLAMLGAVALLFRQLLPTGAALLALLLFALDEAHGVLLAWIANRAAMVSTACATLALVAYIRWRSGVGVGWLTRVAAVAAYALALGFGEYGLCALGYFVAYEWFRSDDRLRARLGALAPFLLSAVLYLCLRALFHATPRHSGVYIDPLTEPLAFLPEIPVRFPVLVSDMLFAARGEYWTFGLPWTFAWYEHGWVPRFWLETPLPWRHLHLELGIVACVLYAWLCRVVLRAPERRGLRFLALGSVLALVPVIGSFPSSRLVLLALLGFVPLLALFVHDGFVRARVRARARMRWAGPMLAALVAAYHVIVPAYLSYTEVAGAAVISERVRRATLTLDIDDAVLPQKDVVVLAAIEGGTSMYVPLARLRLGRPAPHSYSTLSMTAAPYRLARIDENVLTLQFKGRSAMLATAPEQLLRSPRDPILLGETLGAGPFRVTVLGLHEGRPQAMKIVFDRSLDDPSLVFLLPTREGIRRFLMPRLGESVLVPAPIVP